MESGPVYIIGGAIGDGGSSGWLIAIGSATATALLTYVSNRFIEWNKREHDKRTLAASFRAEIGLFVKWLRDDVDSGGKLRTLRSHFEVMLHSKQKLPFAADTAARAPRTVYDASLDRIGMLGAPVAANLVRFYNNLAALRWLSTLGTMYGDYPLEARIDAIDRLLASRPEALTKAEELIRDLEPIADAPGWTLPFATQRGG